MLKSEYRTSEPEIRLGFRQDVELKQEKENDGDGMSIDSMLNAH